MQSQLTVRVSDELNRGVSALAKRLHLKRSDIVRLALERFVGEAEGTIESKPYEKVKSLIGSISIGIPDLGEEHRRYLMRKFKKVA
ncbi:MAG: ribbon-helix-helix protein, CopG family [Nitrospirae bacterium]|nr:ribbon-helix-helix protein, CopG family [Nitrospirota bacterium]